MWYVLTSVPGVISSLILYILYQRKASRAEQLLNQRDRLMELVARVDAEKLDGFARRDALIGRYEKELDELEEHAPRDVASIRARLRWLLQIPAKTDVPDILPDKPTTKKRERKPS